MRIGIDIIEIERISHWLNTDKDKLGRLFTKRELEYFHTKNWAPETVAGMYCAKEAFFKALGTGIIPSKMLELEILHDPHGSPFYKLSPRLVTDHRLSTARLQLSISHTKTIVAVAVCLILHLDAFI